MAVLKFIGFVLKIMAHNLCVILTFGKSKKKWLSLREAVVREMDWSYSQEQIMPTDWGYKLYQECVGDGFTHQESMKILEQYRDMMNTPEYQKIAAEMEKPNNGIK